MRPGKRRALGDNAIDALINKDEKFKAGIWTRESARLTHHRSHTGCSDDALSRAYAENRLGLRPITCLMSFVIPLACSSR